MTNKLNKNSISSVILLTFGIILYFYLIPTQVPMSEGMPMAMSPQLFCKISAGCLILLSLILLFNSQRVEQGEEEKAPSKAESKDQLLRGTISVGIAIVYITLINVLGYFVSTSIALAVFTLFFGARNWLVIISSQIVVLLFIYLLFVKGLHVVLPSGIFI